MLRWFSINILFWLWNAAQKSFSTISLLWWLTLVFRWLQSLLMSCSSLQGIVQLCLCSVTHIFTFKIMRQPLRCMISWQNSSRMFLATSCTTHRASWRQANTLRLARSHPRSRTPTTLTKFYKSSATFNTSLKRWPMPRVWSHKCPMTRQKGS